MASTLAEKIEAAVLEAFRDERSDPQLLRQIVVGPSDDRQVILVWTVDEWDEYGMQEPEGAVARISNAAWFDALDAVEARSSITSGGTRAGILFDRYESSVRPPPLSHPDPAVNEAIAAAEAALAAEVRGALREVAARAKLGTLGATVVGLFQKNLGRASGPQLVAFYHPLGFGELLPLMEKVPPDTLVYPWACLHPAGIALFYPTGEADALDDEATDEVSGTFIDQRFDQMIYTRIEADNIQVHVRGDLAPYSYRPGHTRDTYGPSKEEVLRALQDHVRGRPELLFDPEHFPATSDPAQVERFVQLFIESKLQFEARDLIRDMVASQGIESPSRVLPRLPAEHPGRSQGYGTWARELVRHGRAQEALSAAENVDPTWHYYYWESEVEALLDLGRHQEVLRRTEDLEGLKKGRHSGPRPSATAPYKAMALAQLGRTEEALTLLAPFIEKDTNAHACLWAQAVVLKKVDPAGAARALLASLARGDEQVDRARRDFEGSPALWSILERRARLQAMREAFGAEATAKASVQALPKETPRAEPAKERWVCKGSEPLAEAPSDPPKTIPGAELLLGSEINALASSPSTLVSAGGEGAILYDLGDPEHPVPIAAISAGPEGGGVDLLIQGDTLVLLGGSMLVAATISDPRAPRLLHSLRFFDEDGVRFDALWAYRDLWVLKDRGAWIVHAPAGQPPRLVARYDIDFSTFVADGDTLLFVDTEKKRVIGLDLSDPAQPRIREILRLTRDGGGELDLDGLRSVRLEGGQLVLETSDERLRFERAPAPESTDAALRQRLSASSSLVREMVAAQLHAHHVQHPEFRAGMVMLEWFGDETLRLILDAPRSFVGIESGPVLAEPPRYDLELKVEEPAEEEGRDRESSRVLQRQRVFAWSEMLVEVLRGLPETPGFSEIASGRVFLLARTQFLELARIAVDPKQAWQPFRPQLDQAARRTIEEEIGDHRQTDRIYRRALTDPQVRAEVFRLSQSGDWMAVKIALSLAKVDLEGALGALLIAARQPDLDEQMFASNQHILGFLGKHQERPEVKACLEEVVERGGRTSRMFAALALSREEALLQPVREILKEAKDRGHVMGANVRDDLLKCLAGVTTRIEELRPDLLDFVDSFQGGDEVLLGEVAQALYRAGHPALPRAVAAGSVRAKREEAQHQYRTGIASLDREDPYQEHSLARAQRLWTNRAFVDRARKLAAEEGASLWPPELPLEPFRASWTYFVRVAWPLLGAEALTEWVVEALLRRAQPNPAWAADQELLLALLNYLVAKNELPMAIRLATGALASPAGTFTGALNQDSRPSTDEEVKRRLRAIWLQALTALGFQRSQAGDRAAARQLCDTALREDPTDGQTLFLDARLVWFERSIEAAIQRATESLEKTPDPAGRGRLFNLIGCGLDELKRWPEAIEAFTKAAQAHPEEPMYIANLAECHHKLGDAENAIKFARLARRQGAKAKILAEILGDEGGSS
ncbi:MAG: hypothetical protein U1E65_19325 [Myxococcota bacterium]